MNMPELGPVLMILVVFLGYNAVMTSVFIDGRFRLRQYPALKRWSINIAVFGVMLFLLSLPRFVLGRYTGLFFVVYIITITALVVFQRLALRRKS
ncbi:MAG: hypothetical protein JST70_08910 [Bacteroidetes bacterium]|nr:hypothetical protein [Bacteroidota bacterium]